ncbi:MAG: helix-turn-helix domain-containing protein [Candidatus Saccharibacteria bacterium]|nr:helix-turn-helix domain-containing protein [Candidatus Saccharibacteria bacterium]
MKVLGGKWKILIARNLLERAWRFNELKRDLGASQKALTDALRELEDAGIVLRTVYAEVPPKVEYELTEVGQTLKPVIRALTKWGKAFRAEQDAKSKE